MVTIFEYKNYLSLRFQRGDEFFRCLEVSAEGFPKVGNGVEFRVNSELKRLG